MAFATLYTEHKVKTQSIFVCTLYIYFYIYVWENNDLKDDSKDSKITHCFGYSIGKQFKSFEAFCMVSSDICTLHNVYNKFIGGGAPIERKYEVNCLCLLKQETLIFC